MFDRSSVTQDVPAFAGVDVLSRAMLEDGEIRAVILADAPELKLLSTAEREASLRTFLAGRPKGDVWLFGYGSLMWNPAIRVEERRTATISGWHRAFCLSGTAGRGSPDKPGLFLGLDEGGHCTGAAFRIIEQNVESELSLIWIREMLCGAYVPRWVDLLDDQSNVFATAITFTINRTTKFYAGHLSRDIVVQRLSTAFGGLGTSADYLFKTRDNLRAFGTPDPVIEELAENVASFRAF